MLVLIITTILKFLMSWLSFPESRHYYTIVRIIAGYISFIGFYNLYGCVTARVSLDWELIHEVEETQIQFSTVIPCFLIYLRLLGYLKNSEWLRLHLLCSVGFNMIFLGLWFFEALILVELEFLRIVEAESKVAVAVPVAGAAKPSLYGFTIAQM